MKSFKEFGIKLSTSNLVGDKINVDKILNRQITVTDYRIEDSKYRSGTKCLWLQFDLLQEKKILFIGSKSLIEMIEQIPKTDFPFICTIIRENGRLEFT